MILVIFTEAGSEFGYGHLTRCISLGEQFAEAGFNVVFCIRGSQAVLVNSDFVVLQTDWRSSNEYLNYYNENKDVISVVDSYYSDEPFCRKILDISQHVIFIDDNNRIPYPGGVVLNSGLGAQYLHYPDNEKILYLLGPSYQPLRKIFLGIGSFTVNQNIERVIITFGGSDVSNMTPMYLRKAVTDLPDAKKTVVVGRGFTNLKEIKNEADDNTSCLMYPGDDALADAFLQADIAVSAAGQTLNELARIGIPTIAVPAAENQENNLKYWLDAGIVLDGRIPCNWGNDLTCAARKRMSESGQKLIDGKGMERILEKISWKN